MGGPSFSVIPEYLVDYAKTVNAVAEAVNDAAAFARNSGFGGVAAYGLLAEGYVAPTLELTNHSTSGAVEAAASLGQRVVMNLETTAKGYSDSESALLDMLLKTEAGALHGQARSLYTAVDRPSYSDGGGTGDDGRAFLGDIAAVAKGGGDSVGTAVASLAADGFGYGLDVLGAIVDPWGAVWSLGVGWIIEQVPILRVPIDGLLGQPELIKAIAMTWSNIGGWLKQAPIELQTALPLLASWQGDAATSFRQLEGQFETALAGLGEQCEGLAKLITLLGAMVGQSRSLGIGMISDFVSWIVATIVSAIASSTITFGTSLGAAELAMAIEGEVMETKLALLIAQLIDKLAQAAIVSHMLQDNANTTAAAFHQTLSQVTA